MTQPTQSITSTRRLGPRDLIAHSKSSEHVVISKMTRLFPFATSAISPERNKVKDEKENRFARLSEESTTSSDWSSDDSFEDNGPLPEPSGIAIPLSPVRYNTAPAKRLSCFGRLLSKCGLGLTYRCVRQIFASNYEHVSLYFCAPFVR